MLNRKKPVASKTGACNPCLKRRRWQKAGTIQSADHLRRKDGVWMSLIHINNGETEKRSIFVTVAKAFLLRCSQSGGRGAIARAKANWRSVAHIGSIAYRGDEATDLPLAISLPEKLACPKVNYLMTNLSLAKVIMTKIMVQRRFMT